MDHDAIRQEELSCFSASRLSANGGFVRVADIGEQHSERPFPPPFSLLPEMTGLRGQTTQYWSQARVYSGSPRYRAHIKRRPEEETNNAPILG